MSSPTEALLGTLSLRDIRLAMVLLRRPRRERKNTLSSLLDSTDLRLFLENARGQGRVRLQASIQELLTHNQAVDLNPSWISQYLKSFPSEIRSWTQLKLRQPSLPPPDHLPAPIRGWLNEQIDGLCPVYPTKLANPAVGHHLGRWVLAPKAQLEFFLNELGLFCLNIALFNVPQRQLARWAQALEGQGRRFIGWRTTALQSPWEALRPILTMALGVSIKKEGDHLGASTRPRLDAPSHCCWTALWRRDLCYRHSPGLE